MALLQISEPGESTNPHQHRLVVGIDLGTTNSLVASVRSGVAETLPDDQGRHLLPSVVRYQADHAPVVGESAKAAAVGDSLNTLASIKRLMGRSAGEMKSLKGYVQYQFAESDRAVPRLKTAGGDVTAIEVSAEILKVLKLRAEQTLGGELVGAVVTVPAYFDDAQRQATKDAAALAGLKLYRLLNEPTAAAVAYGLDRGQEGIIAVYDLGGGTFDISILRLSKGVFEVLATGGDTALGGDDFDRAIAGWMLEQSGVIESHDHAFMRRLLRDACAAKEALSEQNSAPLALQTGSGVWHGALTRAQFNELVDPLIERSLKTCGRALRDAAISAKDVMEVVLVGGSTRSPRVRERVGQYFSREPLSDIDPDRVVAIGAALQADLLAGNRPDQDLLLLDVIPLSLGIETMGGLVEKIIPRNSVIPVSKAQDFTTFKNGQSSMSVHVLQGERELVSDCRSLARFELKGIPPMVAGAARIRVTYQIDADGLLNVTAEEMSQGIKAGVEVKPSYGLDDSEIEAMLKDSMAHAQDDMLTRKLREVQVEARRSIEAIDSALAVDGDELLSPDEKQRILAVRELLASRLESADADAIESAMKKLESVSEFYVERRMNESVRRAMSGHSLEEFQ